MTWLAVLLVAVCLLGGFGGGVKWRADHPTSPRIEQIVPCGGDVPHPAQPQ